MGFLFGRRAPVSDAERAGVRLHDELVAAVRQPDFYLRHGVPDTFEGRFDLLILHASIVLRRLAQLGTRGEAVSQHLVDTMFTRFDVAMRELGVSDIGVPKRMKKLAQAFRGRTAAYHTALDAGDAAGFAAVIHRNVLDGRGSPEGLARHMLAFERGLAGLDLAEPDGALPTVAEPTGV